MRLPTSSRSRTAGVSSIFSIWHLISLIPSTTAFTVTPITAPALDLSQLGSVGLAGDFDAISLYQYSSQSESGFLGNGSQSILQQLEGGTFVNLAQSDAYILSMCNYTLNGTYQGIVVGGNFTSLGGVEAQSIALFDPATAKVTSLPGLQGGHVNTVLCDGDNVMVGGMFTASTSYNAIIWVGNTWQNLPFAGFNGPVSSITKESGSGNIIFGGSFDGLGNATGVTNHDQQVVNIAAASIESTGSTTTKGFSDPSNIVCKTSGDDGSGNTWLLADDTPGYWKADFKFGFNPTKLRIWNTHQDGRGTKTFRFTALPINGIMNLTYTPPGGTSNTTCDANCPLSDDTSIEYQDFYFVNRVGMNSFRIDISAWYGSGGGFTGIELFQDDIYAFAINDFNEPSCAVSTLGSTATTTGPWETMAAASATQMADSEYLMANVNGKDANSSAVVFEADIKQSGNYTVTIFTPGCTPDNSCSSRGQVTITGTMSAGSKTSAIDMDIFQTNNFQKYDQVYTGYVDATSDSFRPTITLTASPGQSGNVTVVAQKVRFELTSTTGGLNGLYEYDPNNVTQTADFSTSAINSAGNNLSPDAVITSIVSGTNNVTYVGGAFNSSTMNNIFELDGSNGNNASALAKGGLNAPVRNLYFDGSNLLYVAGNFTNTFENDTTGLNNVAIYDVGSKAWGVLGAGLNGPAWEVVPMQLNVTENKPESVITFSGTFTQILAFGTNKAFDVNGLAIWVPSANNWLQDIGTQTPAISGMLASEAVVNGTTYFGGSLSSQGLAANGAVSLTDKSKLNIAPLPVKIQKSAVSVSSTKKRSSAAVPVNGVVAGLFYDSGTTNITILGGHFTASASDGSVINNLLVLDVNNNNTVTGAGDELDAESVFYALATQGSTLYAGGSLSGKINDATVSGLVRYDLSKKTFEPQLPPLGPDNSVVYTISTRPGTSGDVYVGGDFETAGGLTCSTVCFYSTASKQWNSPGSGLKGSTQALTWAGDNKVVAAGNLTFNDTLTYIATYDTKANTWTAFPGASKLPGPITAITPANADASQLFVAGASTDGTAFLQRYDGKKWTSIGDALGTATTIRGIQVLTLTKEHGATEFLDNDQTLLLTGQLNIAGFGNASAALFNGTTFEPFILSNSNNGPGSLAQLFSQKQNFFKSGGKCTRISYLIPF
jgi:Cortical protein marker for cell polarity